MRRFTVTVNGVVYHVEVEEDLLVAPVRAPAPDGATVRSEAVVPATAAAGPVVGDDRSVAAPLPGLILEVRAVPGQAVAAGDVLVVLEAMKMQNEVCAPRSGVVKEVRVARGATVNMGDVLLILE